MNYHYQSLNPRKALIWRIVHRDNLPRIWDNGLHCGNGELRSPAWIDIGNAELISKRASHPVPLPPGGVLNDYVPFYFTPFSVMIDWAILQRRDFKRDPDDPAKFERYQAEALVYRHCPVEALLGVVCYTEEIKQAIEQQLTARGLSLSVHARTEWYFR